MISVALLFGKILLTVDDGEAKAVARDPHYADILETVNDAIAIADIYVHDSPSIADHDKELADTIVKITGLVPVKVVKYVPPEMERGVVY